MFRCFNAEQLMFLSRVPGKEHLMYRNLLKINMITRLWKLLSLSAEFLLLCGPSPLCFTSNLLRWNCWGNWGQNLAFQISEHCPLLTPRQGGWRWMWPDSSKHLHGIHRNTAKQQRKVSELKQHIYRGKKGLYEDIGQLQREDWREKRDWGRWKLGKSKKNETQRQNSMIIMF